MTEVPGRAPGNRWAWALLAVLAGHLYVLYDPSPPGPALLPGADKIVHVAIFALPIPLAARALRRWWWLALALAVHAPVSEAIQGGLLPGRSADPWDMVADLLGVGLGVGAALLTRRGGAPAPLIRWSARDPRDRFP